MKKILLASTMSLILTHIFFGCSSTRVLTPNEELIVKNKAVIVGTNNEHIPVTDFKVLADSIHASHFHTNRVLHVHVHDIRKIVIYRENAYTLPLIGIGAAIGVAWGMFGTTDNPKDHLAQPIYWSIIFGGLGGGAGYALSKALDYKETILFRRRESSPNF